MNALILACILAGTPMGICQAEFEPLSPPEPPALPIWATEAWMDFAAHIVASEARGVPQADIVVACTMVRDIDRGWHPWSLQDRWFGWGAPDAEDRLAVRRALEEGCDEVPVYRYVGNFRDAQHFRAVGMAGKGPLDLYLGPRGQAVVGVP